MHARCAARPGNRLRVSSSVGLVVLSGTVAKLSLVSNVFRKPWFSGDFGVTIQDALVSMLQTLSPSHPFFVEHAEDILFDIHEDDKEHSLSDAFTFFEEVASSMISTAKGALTLSCCPLAHLCYG